jgi:16S rRNA (guanine527-N7)-methyltransferase
MTPEAFQKASGASDDVLARLRAYAALLEKWQRKINLVGGGSLGDVWRRHILDSAQLGPYLSPGLPAGGKGAAKIIADIGSGAGFPGLVLAITQAGTGAEAGAEFHLIESHQRKCAFLKEANRITGAGVVIHHNRIEKMSGFKADIVIARGVAPLETLLQYAFPMLKKGGQCFFLKGKKWDEELTETQKKWIMKESMTQSLSDPSGMILKLEAIKRRDDS